MKFASLAKYAFVTAATIIGLNMMTASTASAAEVCKIDCVKLRAEYNKLAAKYGVNNKLVKLAKVYLDKVCPPAPTELRIYECSVLQSASVIVPLGLDSTGNLVNSSSPASIVCTTQSACNTVASQRFTISGPVATARCAASSTATNITRLDDAALQLKVNNLP